VTADERASLNTDHLIRLSSGIIYDSAIERRLEPEIALVSPLFLKKQKHHHI
jgi:hypothetical protein